MTNHVALVRDFAQAPRYEAFESPPGEGELVEVLAAALSPRVRSGANGRHYTSKGDLPMVPGIDGVGRLAGGQRVYFVGDGALAERARARLTLPLPESANAVQLAALMLPAISSWVALSKRANLQRGQSVLVLGANGVAGRLALRIAKRLGAGEVSAATRENLGEIPKLASEADVVIDYLWGPVTAQLMPALCREREAESKPLQWVLVGSAAGEEIALPATLLRKRNLHILGSGQGACTVEEMFGVAPAILEALGELHVDAKAVPLAEVERWWNAPLPSGQRLVFVP